MSPSEVTRPTSSSVPTTEGWCCRTTSRKVAAILLMCSSPAAISAGLPKLRKAFTGPIGAYPNIGYGRASDPLGHGHQWHGLDTDTYTPDHLAADGLAWLAMGAQILGGCCATTPDHIAALRRVVPQSS